MNRFIEAKDVFAKVFYLEKLWSNRGDRWFSKDRLTTKQWFFLVVAGSLFDYPPSIKELANAMKTSHQNIKSIALKLQNNGFIELVTDENDRRAKRIKISSKVNSFFNEREKETQKYILNLFKGIDISDLEIVHSVIDKLIANAESEE